MPISDQTSSDQTSSNVWSTINPEIPWVQMGSDDYWLANRCLLRFVPSTIVPKCT